MPLVYIPNKGTNIYTPAERFGELVFVTKGWVDLADSDSLFSTALESLEHSKPIDYIVMSGPYALVSILCSVFALKHNRLNMLIYRGERYLNRELDLTGVE
ncbi:hypothetical protein LCGC14_2033390 [marine sediment metagenome]|uniref:Uncharacterized protein n=1 Tax=marine sediment metagenome TaxID=412755 RepID=A0A0F9ETY8_9ZZZZ